MPADGRHGILAEGGPPTYEANWKRLLAYHHGLPAASWLGAPVRRRTADEVRLAVSQFSEKTHLDDPNDACKYLKIEEFRCLHSHNYRADPEAAATKCVKWFTEWSQCMWDQEKMIKGLNYLEPRAPRKRRPYLGAPDFQYS
eukprot:GHVU01111310.1.p2 GENE.GHVU01111310.1~~GHVU01111310.1.p2  ORF type:complete len:142 (-),score=25.37 GHVU01111310.1:1037-1462(-)